MPLLSTQSEMTNIFTYDWIVDITQLISRNIFFFRQHCLMVM